MCSFIFCYKCVKLNFFVHMRNSSHFSKSFPNFSGRYDTTNYPMSTIWWVKIDSKIWKWLKIRFASPYGTRTYYRRTSFILFRPLVVWKSQRYSLAINLVNFLSVKSSDHFHIFPPSRLTINVFFTFHERPIRNRIDTIPRGRSQFSRVGGWWCRCIFPSIDTPHKEPPQMLKESFLNS